MANNEPGNPELLKRINNLDSQLQQINSMLQGTPSNPHKWDKIQEQLKAILDLMQVSQQQWKSIQTLEGEVRQLKEHVAKQKCGDESAEVKWVGRVAAAIVLWVLAKNSLPKDWVDFSNSQPWLDVFLLVGALLAFNACLVTRAVLKRDRF